MNRIPAAFRLLVLVCAAAVAACSDNGPTSPVGNYVLASVDGDAVPAVMFEDEGYKLEIAGGTLELEDDFSYVAAIVTLETVDVVESEYVDSLRGTWSQATDGTLAFVITDDASTFDGVWQGRRVTITAPSLGLGAMIFARAR